uniref:Cysteine-rich PDZ-binding protein n=1 Tax=Aureoumbra lagunensis TaxID=44058 RepID=A0A7S3NKF5_9STRA|mmetsp:Transcript_17671/g.26546  ORF Transcript_17671/g.26546 Transcript_17671/m.26546 type:complete len:277 (+) Transcript_17671:261-1091(+)
MVCANCEKKLSKVIVPDKWKTGARNISDNGGRATKYKNALLEVRGREQRFLPSAKQCKLCNKKVAQDAAYCQVCAYENGICAMCGIRVDDLRFDRRGGSRKRQNDDISILPPVKKAGDYGTGARFQNLPEQSVQNEEKKTQVSIDREQNDATTNALEVVSSALQHNAHRILTDSIVRPKPQGTTHDYSAWASATDSSSGQVYYYNTLTKQTSWIWPPSTSNDGRKTIKTMEKSSSDFIPSSIFTGRRSGFVFTTRPEHGTGYYREKEDRIIYESDR